MPSSEFLEQLIQEVRNRPCIYNMALENYRRNDIKDNNWQEIRIALIAWNEAQEFQEDLDLDGEFQPDVD